MTTTEKNDRSAKSSNKLWSPEETELLEEYIIDEILTGEKMDIDEVVVALAAIRPEGSREYESVRRKAQRLRKSDNVRKRIMNSTDVEDNDLHITQIHKKYEESMSETEIVEYICENSDLKPAEIAKQINIDIDVVKDYFERYGIKSTFTVLSDEQKAKIKRWGPYCDIEWLQMNIGLPAKTITKFMEKENIDKYELVVTDEQHNALKKLAHTLLSWEEIRTVVFQDDTIPLEAIISYARENKMISMLDVKPVELERMIDMIVDNRCSYEDISDEFPYLDEFAIEMALRYNGYEEEWLTAVQRDFNDRLTVPEGAIISIEDDVIYIEYDDGTYGKKKKRIWRKTPKDIILKALSKSDKDAWYSIDLLIEMIKRMNNVEMRPSEIYKIIKQIDKIEGRNVITVVKGNKEYYKIGTRSRLKWADGQTDVMVPIVSGQVRMPLVMISDLHLGYGEEVPDAWKKFVDHMYELKKKFGHVTITISGDLLEGSLVYGGQEGNKSADVLISSQLKTAMSYLRDLEDPDIEIHLVDGNHDTTFLKRAKNLGLNPLKLLSMGLSNVIYHGNMAWLWIGEKKKIFGLMHGQRIFKGKNLQLAAERVIGRVDSEYKPIMFQFGHVHREGKYKVGKTNVFIVPSLLQPPTELITDQLVHNINCGYVVVYSMDEYYEPLFKFWALKGQEFEEVDSDLAYSEEF